MPAPAKPTLATSLALNLYAASMALPFVLHVIRPRPTGLGLGQDLLHFLALSTLLTASVVLSFKTWGSGRWWLYPVGAVAALVLFFLSFKPIQQTVDYLSFKCKQNRLEPLAQKPAAGSPQQLAAAGIQSMDTVQPGLILFVEDGEGSYQYWGVAYSAADKKPSSHYLARRLYYWHHLEGHWYKWARYDD